MNTISYHYIPEIWHGVLIKGGTEDIMLDVRPLDYQIKGDSNLYQVRMPVGGLITDGIIPKILPYQQLYNICLIQFLPNIKMKQLKKQSMQLQML